MRQVTRRCLSRPLHGSILSDKTRDLPDDVLENVLNVVHPPHVPLHRIPEPRVVAGFVSDVVPAAAVGMAVVGS